MTYTVTVYKYSYQNGNSCDIYIKVKMTDVFFFYCGFNKTHIHTQQYLASIEESKART